MFPFNLSVRRDSRGIVGVNLVLVIAFALYAVIMLSSTTLSAHQIDDRVRVIITEVGPGSNVSRLDETQKLNTIGQTAEDILAAARPLSGQAQTILDTARSIDTTVSAILANASEINTTVKSINATASSLLPVVQTIHGDGSDSNVTGGVDLINRQAAAATPVVSGISVDLEQVLLPNVGRAGAGTHSATPTTGGGGSAPNTNIHSHVNSITCALYAGLLGVVGGASNTCNTAV